MQSVTAHETHDPILRPTDGEAFLTSRQVRQRLGGVSMMTVWRWMHNEQVQFPRPVQIASRNYWRLDEVRVWQAKQAPGTARGPVRHTEQQQAA